MQTSKRIRDTPPSGSGMNVVRTRMQTSKRIKRMWQEERARRVRPTRRLTDEDARDNHSFALADNEHSRWDHVELLDRVRRGVKPMATLTLCQGKHIHLAERVLRRAAREMGLGCQAVQVAKGWVEGVVYQTEGVTLAHFYDTDEVARLYSGVCLPRTLFDAPLESFARSLVREDFDPAVRFPLMGLCLGYPVQETLRYMKGLKLA
jgi:hypothetical protein